MNRLQKYVEHSDEGHQQGTAYAFGFDNLPAPGENLVWKVVPFFNAADEVMRNAGLKDVFRAAIAERCGIVKGPAVSHDPGTGPTREARREEEGRLRGGQRLR